MKILYLKVYMFWAKIHKKEKKLEKKIDVHDRKK